MPQAFIYAIRVTLAFLALYSWINMLY